LSDNEKSELKDDLEKIKIVPVRVPPLLLRLFDIKHPDNRADAIRKLMEKDVEEPGAPKQDNHALYEKLEKELRISISISNKLRNTLDLGFCSLERRAFTLYKFQDGNTSVENLAAQAATNPEIMKTLYKYQPIKFNHTSDFSTDPDAWERFLQYVEMKMKQARLRKTLNEMR